MEFMRSLFNIPKKRISDFSKRNRTKTPSAVTTVELDGCETKTGTHRKLRPLCVPAMISPYHAAQVAGSLGVSYYPSFVNLILISFPELFLVFALTMLTTV